MSEKVLPNGPLALSRRLEDAQVMGVRQVDPTATRQAALQDPGALVERGEVQVSDEVTGRP